MRRGWRYSLEPQHDERCRSSLFLVYFLTLYFSQRHNAQPNPGILKVLLADNSVTEISAASGRFAVTVWVLSSSKIRPAWISSEIIVRLCLWQKATNSLSSLLSQTRPVGLCGLQNKKAFVLSVTVFFQRIKIHRPLCSAPN